MGASLLENNKIINKRGQMAQSGDVITYKQIMDVMSDWDLKRLETYNKNLVDYSLILDLIPKFVHWFFNNKFEGKLQINYSQCAVMLGIGFQKKSIDEISKELNIIKQQSISMLNKSVRKIYTFIDEVIKEYVETNQVRPELVGNAEEQKERINTNTMFDPM